MNHGGRPRALIEEVSDDLVGDLLSREGLHNVSDLTLTRHGTGELGQGRRIEWIVDTAQEDGGLEALQRGVHGSGRLGELCRGRTGPRHTQLVLDWSLEGNIESFTLGREGCRC